MEPTVGDLMMTAADALRVQVGGGIRRSVSDVRLLVAPESVQSGDGVLWVLPQVPGQAAPEFDALVLRLQRTGAAGLVLPAGKLPESIRLLAERLDFPVVGIRLERLGEVLTAWWKIVHLRRLLEAERAGELVERLIGAWACAEDTATFLAAAGGILGAEVHLVEAPQEAGPADSVLGPGAPITWGRGGGSSLILPVAVAAEPVRSLMLALTAVLIDREATEIESDLRVRGELLLELLVERGAPTGSVFRAAERFGMDLGMEHLVVLWDLDDFAQAVRGAGFSEIGILRFKRDIAKRLEQGAQVLFGRAWILPHSDEFVLVAQARSGDWPPSRITQLARNLQASVAPLLGPRDVRGISAGVGFTYSGALGLRKSFDEAHEALLVGRSQFGPGNVTHFKDLGLHRFLYGWFDSPRSRSLAQDFLQPLLSDDTQGRRQLLTTLRAYLEARGRISVAAKQLGIHRNSLRYRLERIQELLNVDLDDPNVQIVLQLVLMAIPA